MHCKIDHSLEDSIPGFLCRVCHPELNISRADAQVMDDADKARREQSAKRQELLRLRQKLTRAETAKSNRGIEERKAVSLRKAIATLEQELAQ